MCFGFARQQPPFLLIPLQNFLPLATPFTVRVFRLFSFCLKWEKKQKTKKALDEGHIYVTLVLNEACSGFLKTETRSLSDTFSPGIVTLCGVRFHVREISLTQRHLSSICKAS